MQLLRKAPLALAIAFATTASAQIPLAEYAARRDSLLAKVPDGVVLALGAAEPAEDFLSFWQAPNFLYLTGVREPNAAMILVKQGGQLRSATLFVQPRNPAAETWTGRRVGVEKAAEQWGIPGRAAADLTAVLDSLAKTGQTIHVVGDLGDGRRSQILTRDAQIMRALRERVPEVKVEDRSRDVMRLRGRRSGAELDLLRRAAAITADAHREAMLAAEPGMNEFELQALIEYTFRRNGADRPGFATIVGSGPNSTILHYNANDRFMQAGDVIVMDIGASYRGYTADVTRTIPVNGKFSEEQRQIYQIVREAQATAERNARPGVSYSDVSDSAAAVLGRGLTRLGLIESPEATYDCGRDRECPQLSLFYMHGLGHGIGLEVHDPDQIYWGPIAAGSAFSIEPGIYVQADVLEFLPDTPRNKRMASRLRAAVQKYGNIGVRIEDDYIVTEKGLEWISRAPREIAEIESLMAQPNTGPGKRNAERVNEYRMFR